MKNAFTKPFQVAVVIALVLVAAAVVYLASQVASLPDEAQVSALIEERLAQARETTPPRPGRPAGLTESEIGALIDERLEERESNAVSEARVSELIEKHLAQRKGSTLSEVRVSELIEQRLAQEKNKTRRAAAPGGLTEKEVMNLIDARIARLGADVPSDEEFNARVEEGIVAFIEKQKRADRERAGNVAGKVRPVGKNDHVRGNPNAPVTLVEYSDFECPFCKRFHATLKQVVAQSNGQVRWVYRHYPLEQLHPVKARKEAAASECAAELGGNEAFWKFADRFFELTPSNNKTDLDTVLPQIAREIGLDQADFASCIASGRHDRKIDNDFRNAMATGGNGTPWTIILSKGGKAYPVSGAQPYGAVKQIVELALEEK